VDHDVGDFQFGQVEQAAETVALFLHHGTFLMQYLDGAANFLVRGQHGFAVGQINSEDLQDAAHDQRLPDSTRVRIS
jgi:hypothetical protein